MNKKIEMIEFNGEDIKQANLIAKKLNYKATAYTSGSALIGLFCWNYTKGSLRGCIIKTEQLGFLFVQDMEDLNLKELI